VWDPSSLAVFIWQAVRLTRAFVPLKVMCKGGGVGVGPSKLLEKGRAEKSI
jgi:hypothetical protein